MAMNKGLILVLAALAAAPLPVLATTSYPEDFTCPIGGERFQDQVIGSYSSWGSRPDGRPYGTLPWVPLPECPGNGFLLFQEEFTPQEIAILTPLVASPEYQAMRDAETQHYRAWWLQRALGPAEAAPLAETLLVATWQTDEEPERKARYQRAFVAAADALRLNDPAWLILTLRAANARRELGDFTGAAAVLGTAQIARSTWPQDNEELEGAQAYAADLAALIAEENTGAEPLSMIPQEIGAERCAGKASALFPSERKLCASPVYQAALAERAVQDKRLRAEAPLVWDKSMK